MMKHLDLVLLLVRDWALDERYPPWTVMALHPFENVCSES